MTGPVPTPVLDTYWRFAARRHAMYLRRLASSAGPWTDDPILERHRFTNTFRAADRVSQYLISEVQWRGDRSQAPDEVFFRTVLFKTFNRIETWEAIEAACGPVSWQSFDARAATAVLDGLFDRRATVYSAAYIMPSPPFGHVRKHANHLALISSMMDQRLAGRIAASSSLAEVYGHLVAQPGLGRFLAFQYAIDLNYSSLIDFDEDEFVVAGPGALDGISKCFSDVGGMSPEQVISWVSGRQDEAMARTDPGFDGLFGRRMKLIDLQNCFCELSKYARVAHPDVAGVAGRTRIKQAYVPTGRPLPQPAFPPKWKLEVPTFARPDPPPQGSLF